MSEELASQTGEYYVDCAIAPVLVPQANDEVLAKQLWRTSVDLVGLSKSQEEHYGRKWEKTQTK